MKLIRFGEPGSEMPGILDGENVRRDLSSVYKDWNYSFFQDGGFETLLGVADYSRFPVVPQNARWASCIARPGKVLCIGLNYSDHAEESGMSIPQEPIVFQKAANTVVGPYDPILIPRNSEKTDWEIELGVVIGKNARYLDDICSVEAHIAGYCIVNDVSERAFQLERGGQWTKGKSCDNFSPTGPFLLTRDAISDLDDLSMSLRVNGKELQKGNTGKMIFNVNFIIHYLTQFMTLEAGDLILTGTPPGVGLGMTPARYLIPGDVVELSIDGLGMQKQVCQKA
ncbi:fumarylacetoacetate hydrolase family protein [Niabella sp. CC-SYL272]|uniref:fumarylacetoacetate hydrolase family protein n=1 Tax=Niabella agricola TaxID=2891571 RepID=UPI001F365050|nr:fumarylacetoacetate hydrolase family protein [Niabella agricola]MCF3108091.1 fumarylacetoacetate hydrolase family protein [Niabella agricola]